MRDYAVASSKFWTGDTGKLLRKLGRDYQVVGFYLFTCHLSNMIGLYYLPLPILCHEVGGLDNEGALKVLRRLSEGGYAHYDEHSEHVFVPEMARHQMGDRLSKKDNRHKALVKLLEQFRKIIYFNDFLEKYRDPFELDDVVPNKPLGSPFEAPSKPGSGSGSGSEAGSGTRTEGAGAGGIDPDNPFERWRDVEACDPTAYETWLEWRASENDTVPERVRIQDAKFLGGKGTPTQQREFIDKLIRLRFKRLHDPIEHRQNGSNAAGHAKPTSDQEALKLRELKDGRAGRGLADFRDPYPIESSEVYATALRTEENRRGIKSDLPPRFPLPASKGGQR